MAQKSKCDDHCEIKHTVLGDEYGNKGLKERVYDLERIVAISIGVVAAINFMWIFFIYPWISKIHKLGGA